MAEKMKIVFFSGGMEVEVGHAGNFLDSNYVLYLDTVFWLYRCIHSSNLVKAHLKFVCLI